MPPKECFEPDALASFSKFGIENVRATGQQGLSRKQRNWLSMAAKLAETSEVTNQHGAVLVKGGRLLALGVNKWRNQALLATEQAYSEHLTVHAEIDALARVKGARGAVLYIARVGKGGEERFSRPCDRCAQALIEAGVKQVVYTIG